MNLEQYFFSKQLPNKVKIFNLLWSLFTKVTLWAISIEKNGLFFDNNTWYEGESLREIMWERMIESGMLEWQHVLNQIQKNLDYENTILILVAFDKVWGHMELIINHLMIILFSNCFALVIGVCLLLVPLLYIYI